MCLWKSQYSLIIAIRLYLHYCKTLKNTKTKDVKCCPSKNYDSKYDNIFKSLENINNSLKDNSQLQRKQLNSNKQKEVCKPCDKKKSKQKILNEDNFKCYDKRRNPYLTFQKYDKNFKKRDRSTIVTNSPYSMFF